VNEYRAPSPPSYLRVVFPAPGFFLADADVALVVNGQTTWRGSFKQGFDWWAETPPGTYVVVAQIAAPLGFTRSKTYTVTVQPSRTTIVVLEYSRMWGNFTERPARVDVVPR
jgi:hypothetical protein